MRCFGVMELSSERISNTIAAGLKACGYNFQKNGEDSFENNMIFMVTGKNFADFKNIDPDLMVVSPKIGAKGFGRYEEKLSCRHAIIPGENAAGIIEAIRSDHVMSYGMSDRDTITVSSIDDPGLVLSLQREIVTIDGRVLEQQELPVYTGLTSPQAAMAAAGALLLLGVAPKKLLIKAENTRNKRKV